MTPEQREHIIRTIENGEHFGGGPVTTALRACLAAADRAMDPRAESNRQLGATVRDIVTRAQQARRYCDDEVLDAIAAALRDDVLAADTENLL